MIGKAWEEQRAIKEVMVFLQGVGVSTSLALTIHGDLAGARVRTEKGAPDLGELGCLTPCSAKIEEHLSGG